MKKKFSLGAILVAVLFAVLAVSTAQGQSGKTAVLISFDHQPGPSDQALVRGAGGDISHTFHLVPVIAASLPEGAINGLRNNSNITAIEADGQFQASDAELSNSWGVLRIGAGAVHDGGNKGFGVKVATIAGGYDFVNGDNDPTDDMGHGTHVAGTLAALDDGLGVVGVAPDASIYALKVLDSSGSGSFSNIIAALQWAVDNGIQVTNNSYSSSLNPGSAVEAAFINSAAAGVIHVA